MPVELLSFPPSYCVGKPALTLYRPSFRSGTRLIATPVLPCSRRLPPRKSNISSANHLAARSLSSPFISAGPRPHPLAPNLAPLAHDPQALPPRRGPLRALLVPAHAALRPVRPLALALLAQKHPRRRLPRRQRRPVHHRRPRSRPGLGPARVGPPARDPQGQEGGVCGHGQE